MANIFDGHTVAKEPVASEGFTVDMLIKAKEQMDAEIRKTFHVPAFEEMLKRDYMDSVTGVQNNWMQRFQDWVERNDFKEPEPEQSTNIFDYIEV